MAHDMTTVKLRRATRERLSQEARARHATIDEYLSWLLDEHLWRVRMDGAKRAMSEDDQEYAEEVASWETTAGDGLA